MRRTTILVLMVLLTACGQGTEVTEADDGGSVEIEVGDTFTVSLPANPSTGFTWTVNPFDANVVEQVGEAEFEPESDLVGAPGVYSIQFEGRAAGTVELVFDYERTFEDAEPEDTFQLTVTVR